jgi:glucose-6-phosphate isomerase
MAESRALWDRYRQQLFVDEALGFSLDISRMDLDDAFFAKHEAAAKKAFADMQKLEAGAIANPDEKRMVGHYWLRAPELAPDATIKSEVESTLRKIHAFAADVHSGKIRSEKGDLFQSVLVVGIGGSALGPQFVGDALGTTRDRMRLFFFDNTDPEGIDRVLSNIQHAGGLSHTLVVVISKSGGTKETRNGMLEAAAAYRSMGLNPARHFVAVTGADSELDKLAVKEGWMARFPMWDWVGGRTSELAAVGLLPAALQGLDIDAMLAGARAMDVLTRNPDAKKNPAALLALSWLKATNGKGEKDMVVLPYKDRLVLLSKYLQQLVMESLGKEKDLDGKVANQGIAVYGNKGSTDQHAYVQQLRDGVSNFFCTFIGVHSDRKGTSLEVEPGVTSGDFLMGFQLGTRRALYESGRGSITITVDDVNAKTVGLLIALYERAVGLYASFVNINAYHQPGVEAGKKAAQAVIALQHKIVDALAKKKAPMTLDQLAEAVGEPGEIETVFQIVEHLAHNGRGVKKARGTTPFDAKYSA